MSVFAEWLKEGARVRLLEYRKPIDELKITKFGDGEMEAESQKLCPGSKTEFLFVPRYEGWKVMTYGLGGERGYAQVSPTYAFEPIEETS